MPSPVITRNSIFSVVVLFATSCATADKPSVASFEDTLVTHRSSSLQDRKLASDPKFSSEYHYSLGHAYSLEGKTDLAIEELEHAFALDQKSTAVLLKLSQEYLKKGSTSEALDRSEKALALSPDSIEVHLFLGSLFLNKKSSEKALFHYERVLKKDLNNLEALLSKAQALLDLKRPTEASKYLKGLTKSNPQSAAIWYYYGRTEHFLNKLPTAAHAYEKAFELRPNFAQAGLAWAMVLEQQNKDEAALKAYELVYEKSQDLNAAQQIASLYIAKEKYSESVPYLETLVANDAEDLNHQIKLALVYLKVDDYQKAKKVLSELHLKQPDSDKVNYYLAHLQEKSGNLEGAFIHAKKIPADSKYFEETRLNATFWLRGLKRNDEAKSFIDESIKMNPGKSAFYVLASSMDEERGDLQAALRKLEDAKKRFADDEKILYYLGVLYEKDGKIDSAINQMEQILAKNPNNSDAMNFIGYTWTIQGKNMDRVQELLAKAMKLNPENAYIVDSWGWFLHVRGKTNEALPFLEKAAAMKPDEPAILEHLGDAYSKKNFRGKALKMYKNAKQFVKDETLKAKLSEKINVLKNELAQQETPTTASHDAPRSPAAAE